MRSTSCSSSCRSWMACQMVPQTEINEKTKQQYTVYIKTYEWKSVYFHVFFEYVWMINSNIHKYTISWLPATKQLPFRHLPNRVRSSRSSPQVTTRPFCRTAAKEVLDAAMVPRLDLCHTTNQEGTTGTTPKKVGFAIFWWRFHLKKVGFG